MFYHACLLGLGLILASFKVCLGGAEVEIVGHRGASFDAPENTVAAVRLAYRQGADAAEVDIYLSRDGQIVVMHDADTERTTGVKWPIAEKTLAELKTLDAGGWKASQFKGEPIPTLGEVLDAVPAGKKVVIEIKCGPEVLAALQRQLEQWNRPPADTVIIGFDYETVCQAKRNMPERPVLWLFGTTPARDKKTKELSSFPQELLERCQQGGLDGLDLKYDGKFDSRFARQMHAAGLKLYVWTVDDAQEAMRLCRIGVDSITTNRPAWLRQQLEQLSKEGGTP